MKALSDRTKAAVAVVGLAGVACMVGGAFLLHPGAGWLALGLILLQGVNVARDMERGQEIVVAMEATDDALRRLEEATRRQSPRSYGSARIVQNPPPSC